jgi:hypothetical protein
VDLVVWPLLLIGLGFARTRLACATALVLWLVPAVGNVFSLYDLRYEQPMAGIGLASGFLVLALLAFDVKARMGRAAAAAPARS